MKSRFIITFLMIVFISAGNNTLFAQQPSASQNHWSRADSAAINALIMYPDSIRINIFEACEYPALIVRIATEQKNTSAGFDSLVTGYSRDEQQDIWDLSRYPGLIQQIVTGGRKSKQQLEVILADYPADIHETGLKGGDKYFDVLQKIDQLQAQTDQDFQQMIAEYPPVTQRAFNQLIQLPEVLSLLNDHLNITVLVGDHYKKNPDRIIRKTDSLNLVFARQHAEDVQAWQDSIQQNPQAQSDLEAAAGDYAKENGYSDDDINAQENPNYVDNYSVYPYSYWFGYPSWYPYSYWYPYPYWYDCGFYYGPHHHIVFIGVPSYNFTNWYFYHPEHWHKYPHLGNAYVSHYYGSRHGIVNGNTVIVHKWVHDNKSYLPQDFITNKSRRVDAIKQVGQLNEEARKGKTGVATVQEKNQYIQTHAEKYPALNASTQPKMQEQTRQQVRIPENIEPPVKAPPVRIQRQVQEPTNATTPQRQPKPAAPVYNYNNVNRAQEYHRSTWEQSQPAPRPQPQQHYEAPAPQQHYEAPRPSAPAPRSPR